ncbi:hypothetical protein D3C77_659470 [compost metagenome]
MIAAPTNLMNGEVQFALQVLQLLPNGAATHPEGCPQSFSGMEPTILEEIQQLQHASLDLE